MSETNRIRPSRASAMSLAGLMTVAREGALTRPSRELVDNLVSLIRLRTVNPPGNELMAARFIERRLSKAGVPVQVYEPYPRRGSVVARLRGDGTAGGPLLLLSHLDVVPADRAGWTHPPFAGNIQDGQVYGRGAADMKFMVALELQVMLELARYARSLSVDPSRDVVPGLRRDVIFASTADEESGGERGIGWLVENRPQEIMADVAINEAGGFSVYAFGRAFYPIQVAEKGRVTFRVHVTGSPGHGAMPRPDNVVLLMARLIDRFADLEPINCTPVMASAFKLIETNLPTRVAARFHTAVAEHGLGLTPSTNWLLRVLQSATRNTFTPTIANAGVKYNVIPGSATVEIDCRTLPGTSQNDVEQTIRKRIGDDLLPHCKIEVLSSSPGLEQPLDHPILVRMANALREYDRSSIPVHLMAPFSTDARHTRKLGIPTYGFSPLKFNDREPFLMRFHADDERVSIPALHFGLRVLLRLLELYCVE